MPLMTVPSRHGDSLPAHVRTGVKEWQGTPLMPSLRLSASGAGLSGMSVWYGSSAGPWGFGAYQWPPYGRRGLSGGLGQDTVDVSTLTPVGDGTFTDSSGNVYDSSGNIISSSTSLTDQSALQNLPTLPSNAPTAIEYPTQGGDNHIDARDHRQHADYGATSGGLQPAGGLRPKTPYQLEVFLTNWGMSGKATPLRSRATAGCGTAAQRIAKSTKPRRSLST